MRNLSYENEFRTQFHFHTNQSHFHKNGFALRLALKQSHKGTQKWSIHVNEYEHGWRDVKAVRKCQLRSNFATIGSCASFGKTTRVKEKYCLISSAISTTSKVLYKSSKLLQSRAFGTISLDTGSVEY